MTQNQDKKKCKFCGSTENVRHYIPSGDICEKCTKDPERIKQNEEQLKKVYNAKERDEWLRSRSK